MLFSWIRAHRRAPSPQAEDAPPAPPPRIAGWVDGVRDGRIVGWACSREAPAERLDILIETGPNGFTRVRADSYRSDVLSAGVSPDGYCGFSLPLARVKWDGPIRVLAEQFEEELPGGPVDWARAAARPEPHREQGLEFALDGAGGRLSGWVLCGADPASRRMLQVEIGDTEALRARAALYRAEAESVCGDGFHGFALPSPPAGRRYVLRDLETGAELLRQGFDG